MKCAEFRNLTLLARDGECPERKRQPMEEHKRACPACRSYENDLGTLLLAARTESNRTVAGPSDAVVRRIMETARGQAPQRVPEWRLVLRPLAAMAAGLALIFGLWHFQPTRSARIPATTAPVEGTGTFGSILALVLNHDSANDGVLLPNDRDAMARHILILQGMVEMPESEEVTAPEEPLPTGLLRHSKPAVLAGKCG